MADIFSLDEQILQDRKSTYLIKVTGKKARLNLVPGDILVINRNLPHDKDKLALLVRQGKFCIDLVTSDLLKNHDPENGDFIWGMVQTVVREL